MKLDFDLCVSILRTEIDKLLKSNGSFYVTKEFIAQHIRKDSCLKRDVDDKLVIPLIQHLERIYCTTQATGYVLTKDFKEWYPQRMGAEDSHSYFWKRLHKHWRYESTFPIPMIKTVDTVTNEIIGYLGDPLEQGNWCRRGLVMGHVQSGKTTNYSALITKAADAGYRIIIVLAGITNSLRYQTQIRLDEAFVGKSSLGDNLIPNLYPICRAHDELDASPPRHPYCGTTQSADFNQKIAKSISASEGNFADPILFVTKKNEKVLESLANWLKGLRQGSQLEGPMLIIDDEADNASINTSKDPTKPTRINERIRALLQCSRRASYVGYTATPFANIFIDPDSEDDMLKNDLFPEHFIKSLEPPSNYIGAKDLFDDENSVLYKACVREIPEDYKDTLPLNHKSGQKVIKLPHSLRKAVLAYFLVRATRILAGDGEKHSSMLINVSRFNLVQQKVHDLIYEFLCEVKDCIEAWAASDSWADSPRLNEMHELWLGEFQTVSQYEWTQVRKKLKSAIAPIEIKLVNMKGGSLDYKKSSPTGMHVIAVGGLALARGLTLEGLSVSYVLRNVGAADTLLQIGRWFGYRPGYESLCRIYATDEMINHFKEVSQSVEELRHDLMRMEKLNLTPDEFGLKVRHSPTGIAITATNKMRTATSVPLAADFSCKHIQAYELFDEISINKEHRQGVDSLISELTNKWSNNRADEKSALVWRKISVELVLKLLKRFDLPNLFFANMDEKNLLSDYINDRKEQELMQWDIAIPHVRSGKSDLKLPYSSDFFCRSRYSGKIVNKDRVKILAKNVVADPEPTDIRYGEDDINDKVACLRKQLPDDSETEIHLKARTRPLLVIHIFDFKVKDGKSQLSSAKEPILSISLAFPQTKVSAKTRSYAATKRLVNMMETRRQESNIDENLDDEE